jgi:hypothetical protein
MFESKNYRLYCDFSSISRLPGLKYLQEVNGSIPLLHESRESPIVKFTY